MSRSLLLSASVALFAILYCSKPPDGMGAERFVTAPSGLNLREEPSSTAALVQLLPFGARVMIVEERGPAVEIDSIPGKWTRVTAGASSGWVFGGYLGSKSPVSANASNLSTERLFRSYKSYSIKGSLGSQVSSGSCRIGAFGSTWCRVNSMQFEKHQVVFIVAENALSDDPQPESRYIEWTCFLSRKVLESQFGGQHLEFINLPGDPVYFNCASQGSSDYPPAIEK